MLVELRSCIPMSCAVLYLVLLLVASAAAACACVCCTKPVPVALFWVAGMRRGVAGSNLCAQPVPVRSVLSGWSAQEIAGSVVCALLVPGWSAWRWGRCLCLGACLGGPLGALPLLGCLPLVRWRLGGFAFAWVPLYIFLSSAIRGDLNYRHHTHLCPDGPWVYNRRPLGGKEVIRIIVIPHTCARMGLVCAIEDHSVAKR